MVAGEERQEWSWGGGVTKNDRRGRVSNLFLPSPTFFPTFPYCSLRFPTFSYFPSNDLSFYTTQDMSKSSQK